MCIYYFRLIFGCEEVQCIPPNNQFKPHVDCERERLINYKQHKFFMSFDTSLKFVRLEGIITSNKCSASFFVYRIFLAEAFVRDAKSNQLNPNMK